MTIKEPFPTPVRAEIKDERLVIKFDPPKEDLVFKAGESFEVSLPPSLARFVQACAR